MKKHFPAQRTSPVKLLSPPSPGRSTGKIARLPADLRNSINQWITDGVPFDTISQRLADLGHPGITHQNISKWKLFGYQKWLHHQEQLDDQRSRYQMACTMAKELGLSPDSTNACAILLTTRLYELLLSSADQSDPETVRKDTLQILQLSRSLSVFFGQNARTERFQFDQQRHQDKVAAIKELARSKVFHSEDHALNQFSRMLGLRPRGSASEPGRPSDVGRASVPASPEIPPSPLNGDLRSLGSDERNSPEVKADRPSERARASHWAGVRGETAPDASSPQSSSVPHSPIQQSIDPAIQQSSPSTAPSRHPTPPCATQNTTPTAQQSPSSSPSEIQPSTHPSIQQSDAPFPISPLATTSPGPEQPCDHIPIFDRFGAWVSWIPRSGPDSGPTFEDAILFENSRGKRVCWLHPKWLEQSDPSPDRLVALLNADGRILRWIPQPDLIAPPPIKSVLAIRSRRYRFVTAWLQEFRYNERCGALVG